MPKSNRQRMRNRVIRQANSARKRAAAERRRQAEAESRAIEQMLDRIYDPSTPVAELAALIAVLYQGEPVRPGLVELLAAKGATAERLAEVADLLATEPVPSLTWITFAAGTAWVAGDRPRARGLLDQALERSDPDENLDRWEMVVRALGAFGRAADAIGLIEDRLRGLSNDGSLDEYFGVLIEQIDEHIRAADSSPAGYPPEDLAGSGCPCGAGQSWHECCELRERAALERFTDRSALAALRRAVMIYQAGSPYRDAIHKKIDANLADAEIARLGPDSDPWQAALGDDEKTWRLAVNILATDHAMLTAGLSDDEPDESGNEDNVLTEFAASTRTPPDLAALALTWRDRVQYGLWQVESPEPGPGQWCTEIVTGTFKYIEIPRELAAGLPRWAVLLGAMLPVDGVWRAFGPTLRLSPTEADALAERVNQGMELMVRNIAGTTGRVPRRLLKPVPLAQAPPHGVLASLSDPASPLVTRVAGLATAALLFGFAAHVHRWRATPPAMTNTDGDPMCLVTARIAVNDPELALAQLAGTADFRGQEPGRLTWYGKVIPESQRKAMLADARARLSADGEPADIIDDEPGPHRWVRGELRIDGGELVAEVNSVERLGKLVRELTKAGAAPRVTDQTRVDPAMDLPWPAGEHVHPGGLASPELGWEKHWLDERVPALGGRTPRQAAQSGDREKLEALLRQFEYQADLLAFRGKSGPDTAWLRRELGMPSWD